MISRKYTDNGKCVAEIKRKRGKDKFKKEKRKARLCRNLECKKKCSGYTFLKSHVMKKNNESCKKFYIKNKLLKELIVSAKQEKIFREKTAKQTKLDSILETSIKEFTTEIKDKLNITVNAPKMAAKSGSVENGPMAMKALDPDNREAFLSICYFENDQEKEDTNELLDRMLIIISITNSIGKIYVKKFLDFVKDTYLLWINKFGKFVHVKSSLHWTLAHAWELIQRNGGYTMAEYSENSFENWIKHYRYVTVHQAKQTSIRANNIDSLRAMYLPTRHEIRQYHKVKPEKKESLENSRISEKINSFFILQEDGKKWSFTGLEN